MENQKLLLNENDLEREYGLSKPWLRKRRRLKHAPPFIRLDRMIKYNRSALESWLAQHVVEPRNGGRQ